VYHFLKWLARLVVLLAISYRVQGRENVPAQGPLLVVANHVSVADPVLIGISLNRRVVFMAKEELFTNWFYSYIIRSFGAFPVSRGHSSRDALRQAVRILKRGGVLGMFPEGKRSTDGCLMPPMDGAALVACHTRSRVLPIGIIGSEVIRGYGWIWRRPKVTMVIGRPFYLPGPEPALKKEQLPESSRMIMQNIAALLPEKQRGEYSGLEISRMVNECENNNKKSQ
jgi:1-acyl-sn-glycerol-3-phosphate acyltransferase